MVLVDLSSFFSYDCIIHIFANSLLEKPMIKSLISNAEKMLENIINPGKKGSSFNSHQCATVFAASHTLFPLKMHSKS
jgi:hypothetical protein